MAVFCTIGRPTEFTGKVGKKIHQRSRNLGVTYTDIPLHNLFLAVEVVREQYKHITSRGELLCHLCLGRIWDCKLHLHQKGSETVRVSNSTSALNKAPQVLKSGSHKTSAIQECCHQAEQQSGWI